MRIFVLILCALGCSAAPEELTASLEQESLIRCINATVNGESMPIWCAYDRNGDGDALDSVDQDSVDANRAYQQSPQGQGDARCYRETIENFGPQCFFTKGMIEGTAASQRVNNVLVNPFYGRLSRVVRHRTYARQADGTCPTTRVFVACPP